MKMADQAGLLYDFAANKPEGFTWADVEREFGWSRPHFFKVVRRLRLDLGADEINLVCTPKDFRGLWLYELVGDYESAAFWASNRIGDMEARLGTIKNVAGSVETATDGRTVEGKIARKIHNTVSYLLVELSDLRDASKA
jgi:hypothetical protein